MSKAQSLLFACATSLFAVTAAHAADRILSGAIAAQSGQKLEGVTVSAKLEGSTITTSVYTDTAGNYFFPPLPAGKYRVWAQALGFETGKGAAELSATRRADFTLQEMSDPERRFRQLPGEMMVAALPEASADDARAKKIFMNNCTGCHSTSYALQFRFDEAGWSKIIDLMKVVPVTGVYPGPNAKSNQIMERHQKQLAAYLARVRGPGESSMKIAVRPRPAGESARVVWTLYDLPLNPDAGIGTRYNPNDGTDWSLDTRTERITIYQTPESMAPVGGAVTIDVDGKGMVWASTPSGAVRFDPVAEKFTEFKSMIPEKNPRGSGATYGAAGDREGNGWWAQIAMDTVYKGDVAAGKTIEIKMPDVKVDRIFGQDRAFYETVSDLGFNAPLPWSQGPRRMGTDKNADLLWVGNSYGSSWAKINTKTLETTIVPLPDPAMQAYHIAVDSKHRVWGNLWTSDRIVRLDPSSNTWTIFDLPARGTEIRHIALLERGDKLSVVVPVYRTSQMGVMTVRSEAELAALKTKAQ